MSDNSVTGYIEKLSFALEDSTPEDRGQLRLLTTELPELFSDEQIAAILEAFPIADRIIVWDELSAEIQKDVFYEMREESKRLLLKNLDTVKCYPLFESMEADDLLFLEEEIPDKYLRYALSKMDLTERSYYELAQAYPIDQIGHWQSFDRIRVEDWVRADSLKRYIPEQLPPHTEVIYVVDKAGKLLGEVKFSRILKADDNVRVTELMEEDCEVLVATDNVLEAADEVVSNNHAALPIVDAEQKLLGRLDISAAYHLKEEWEPSLQSSATTINNDEDLFASVLKSSKSRALWLGINLITALMASAAIGLFESTIEKVVALAILMPIVASMGGISGSQSLTLVIRGLALGQISSANRKIILIKELKVGLLNGTLWAIIIGLTTLWWFEHPMLSVTIGGAIFFNLLAAPISGVTIPIILQKLKIDPALSGAVILTTVTDIVGFVAFLGLGTLILL